MDHFAITVTDLGKKYDKTWGLKNATFTMGKGELAVLVGPNGAGKTTTMKILATLLKPSKGKAEVLGMDIVKDYKRIRKKMACLPQGFGGNRNLTPMETIRWSLVARGWSLSDAKGQAIKWIETVGLSDCKDRTGWTLSGGQQRKVVVSTVLAANAEVVFLDEPTTGLDVEARHAVWKIIRETVADGSTVLLTTHDMNEAETIADTAVLINDGQTLVKGTPQRLVKMLPYQYRITVKKGEQKSTSLLQINNSIDLGDRVIFYTENYREIKGLMSNFTDLTNVVSVDRVGLEDAYLHLIHEVSQHGKKIN